MTSVTSNTESMIKVWITTDYLILADRNGDDGTQQLFGRPS
jgi:hypothetical protein